MKKILVVQVAGWGFDLVRHHAQQAIDGITLQPLESIFPAVTCTAQATMRTGALPGQHGMVANGFFDTTLKRAAFWEQSAHLVQGARIWEDYRARGGRVGMTFFQQSLGETVDWVISPAPIHKHDGGMIMGCYSKPDDLYTHLERAVGRSFKLYQYWGPLASAKGSAWITQAISQALRMPQAPGVLFTYLPGLDYDLQRFGPAHPRSRRALAAVTQQLVALLQVARTHGYEMLAYGDYAITPVTSGAIFPNRLLRQAGLFKTRAVKRMAYPDFYQSPAFAVVDHQVALVHCFDPQVLPQVRKLFEALAGVAEVLDKRQQEALGIAHARAGDLLLVAEAGAWFAYPWWDASHEAPDFATHVDIHNKPGFDPCELFFGRSPLQSSLDTTRIKGTHGRAGAGCESAWFSTCGLQARHLVELSQALRAWLAE